jgi:uncharacterized protein YceK
MRHMAMGLRLKTLLVLILTVILAGSGCSVLKSKKGPGASTPGVAAQPSQSQTVYMDFGDVLLPTDLKVDNDDSFVFSAAGLTAGVLSLKGRVEVESLIAFFENRMPEDGWQMISEIKAGRSMLLFRKQARWCVISIEEGQMSTHVQIWVAPTLTQDPTGSRR